jgi:hypothetical protein
MADYVPPKQSPELPDNSPHYAAPAKTGGGGTGQIILGLVMLVGGIGLSVAGTGRVFIGLIAVGAITLVKGLANAGK